VIGGNLNCHLTANKERLFAAIDGPTPFLLASEPPLYLRFGIIMLVSANDAKARFCSVCQAKDELIHRTIIEDQ
jgi:hypothetical protein